MTEEKKGGTTVQLLKNISGVPLHLSPVCDEYENFNIKRDLKIGSGTYGKVYEACRHGKSCDKFVAKITRFHKHGLERQHRAFVIESILAEFAGRHGFGVPIQTFFICDKGRQGIIIMDRYESVEPEDFTAPQVRNLLQKVDAMHEAGILHCDLFPRNVLKKPGSGNEMFIIDFGLAFALKEPVPLDLRATDVLGLLFGDPPDLTGGIYKRSRSLAYDIFDEYVAKHEAEGHAEDVLEGMHMRVNYHGTLEKPKKGGKPFKIDCQAYNAEIERLMAPVFRKQLGGRNLYLRQVWNGRSICVTKKKRRASSSSRHHS